MLPKSPNYDKRCFAYCGDDRCDCDAHPNHSALLALRPQRPTADETSQPRFFPSRIPRQE